MWAEANLNYKPLSPEEISKQVEKLRDQLAAHETEPILVVQRGWDKPGIPGCEYKGGCFGGRYEISHRLEEKRFLGISTEPFITVTDVELLEIYTPRHTYFEGSAYSPRTVRVKDRPIGDLVTPFLWANSLNVSMDGLEYDFMGYGIRPGVVVEVLIGEEAIAAHYQYASEKNIRGLMWGKSDADERVKEMRKNQSPIYQMRLNKRILAEYDQMRAALFDTQAVLIPG